MGSMELVFFLDSTFNGTADCIQICSSTDLRPIKNASLQRTKCARMWISLKRRFPLLGALVNERLGDEGADFVVTESCLGKVVSDKIDFSSVSSMQGA